MLDLGDAVAAPVSASTQLHEVGHSNLNPHGGNHAAELSPGRDTQRERHLPSGPACHRCSQTGLGRDVKLHSHRVGGRNGSIVARRHRQQSIRPGLTRPTWSARSPVPDSTGITAQEPLAATPPVPDDVAVLYQLLRNLSLAEEPVVVEEKLVLATTETQVGNASNVADEVISIVRAPASIYRFNPTAILAPILGLQGTCDRWSIQVLHPTLPSTMIPTRSQRAYQLVAFAAERRAVGHTFPCLQPQMLTQSRVSEPRNDPCA